MLWPQCAAHCEVKPTTSSTLLDCPPSGHSAGAIFSPLSPAQRLREPPKSDVVVEGGFGGRECVFGDGAVELADALLFIAAGDAHEETDHLRHRGKGVGVIVVEAETEVGVGESGVERFGADEAFAGADAAAWGGFSFGTDGVLAVA